MGQTVKIKICNLSRSPKSSLSSKVRMLWELSQPVVFPCLWATFFVRRSFAAIYFYLETTSGNKRTIIIIILDCYDCHKKMYFLSHRAAAASLNHQLFQHVEGKRAHGKASWRRRRRLDKNRSLVEKASPDAIFWTVDWEIKTMNNEQWSLKCEFSLQSSCVSWTI